MFSTSLGFSEVDELCVFSQSEIEIDVSCKDFTSRPHDVCAVFFLRCIAR